MISLFLVTPVRVINCVLFFLLLFVCLCFCFGLGFFVPSFILFVFFLLLLFFLVCSSIELMVKHQSFLFLFLIAETVVTDVALVMVLFLFCVADCCADRRRILGVFLIF